MNDAIWIKLSVAAALVGLPVNIFRSEVETGKTGITLRRFGKRDLLMVPQDQVLRYRESLKTPEPR